MTRWVIVVLALAAASMQAHAMYTPGGALKLVNAKNFKQKILDSELPAIVEFYAPWCVPPLLCCRSVFHSAGGAA